MLSTLFKWAPDFASNPLSAINCTFEENFDPTYNVAEGCCGTFDQALTHFNYCNIDSIAVRDVSNGEELLILFKKPEPTILES